MIVNFYLILSLIFGGVGLGNVSSYFDSKVKNDYSYYKKNEAPLLINIKPNQIYPFGLKQTGLEPKVNAKSAIAIDIDNGQILYAYNDEQVLPMASLTKIMTSIVALEQIPDFNKSVIITREEALIEGSRMNLWMDEKIRLIDVLYGLLLKSGNDAAKTIEDYYDNNIRSQTCCETEKKGPLETPDPNKKETAKNNPGFVDLMNQKARDLGLNEMKYEDSSGISENNVSSARDLAYLLNYAMRNEEFAKIIATPQYTAAALNGSLTHPMSTTNRLLRTRTDVLAGKTGYSEAAGYNLITLFRSPNNHRIVTIVFGTWGIDERFDETNKIIDWVYTYYRY